MSIRGLIGDYLRKAPSVISEFAGEPEAVVRYPKWNLSKLYKVVENDWVLQEVIRVIVQEVKRPGWSNQFKFVTKCKKCDAELPGEYKQCPKCGGKRLRKPEPAQLALANRLIARPNSSRQPFGDILGSIIYHDCVADQWLISVSYAPVTVTTNDANGAPAKYEAQLPKEIYVEHPINVHPIMDERGRLGNNEHFCPYCFPEKSDKVEEEPFKCPACGRTTVKTAYIQKISNDVKNRFGVDQMVHGSTYRVLPDPRGVPRLVSLWELVHALEAYNDWFFDTYASGKVGKIIDFKGYDPDQVKAMAIKMREAQLALDTIDAATGEARPKRSVRNVLVGSQDGIAVHDTLPDPQRMQALDYYMLGIHGVCGVFGVQPLMIAMKEDRAGGQTPYLKLEVNGHTIEEIQRDKEEVITEYLYPIFGIHDVAFKFGPIEKKDAERDARVSLMRAQTVKTWTEAGFSVRIDAEGRVQVSAQQTRDPDADGKDGDNGGARDRGGESPREGKRQSEASGADINATTVERYPKGPRDDPSKGMVV